MPAILLTLQLTESVRTVRKISDLQIKNSNNPRLVNAIDRPLGPAQTAVPSSSCIERGRTSKRISEESNN